VGGFQSPLSPRRRERDLATIVTGEDGLGPVRNVDEVADAGEDVGTPVELECMRSDLDATWPGEWEERGLESLESDHPLPARCEGDDAQAGVPPPSRVRHEEHRVRAVGQRSGGVE